MPKSPGAVITSIAKPLSLTIMAVVLFALGLVGALYSPWLQDGLRERLLAVANRQPDLQIKLDRLRLWFPLRVELGGVSVVQRGDTLIGLETFDGNVRLLPLLTGTVDITDARATGAYYRVGNLDSATCVVIRADSADISPASVRLGGNLGIKIDKGILKGGLVDLYINPNPPKSAPADTAKSGGLTVDVVDMDLVGLQFRMNMLPTIDSLGVTIDRAHLRGGHIDLGGQTVDVSSLRGHGLHAAYIAPDSATIANTVVAPPDTTSKSAPWRVRVTAMDFDRSSGLYTTRGVEPLPGLDFAYIAMEDMQLRADSFYNCADTVRLPIQVSGTERCGVTVAAAGTLGINGSGLTFDRFRVSTPNYTRLDADAYLGMGDMTTDPSVPVRLTTAGDVAPGDLAMMFPAFKAYLRPLRQGTLVPVEADAAGTMGQLEINRLAAKIPGVLTLNANGTLTDVMADTGPNGDIEFAGSLGNVNPWLRMFVAAKTGVRVPSLTYGGDVTIDNGDYTGTVRARTGAGKVVVDGGFDGRGDSYDIDLDAVRLPVNAFMPDMGIGEVTAHITAHGHGFDPLAATTAMYADIDVGWLEYQGVTYSMIRGNGHLADGRGTLDLSSDNPGLQFTLNGDFDTSIDNFYDVRANLDCPQIDLLALKMAETATTLSGDMDFDATFDGTLTDVAATLRVNTASYRTTGIKPIEIDNTTVDLHATDTTTVVRLTSHDLLARFATPNRLDSLMAKITATQAKIASDVANRHIYVTGVQEEMPQFTLTVTAGNDNVITNVLKDYDMAFKRVRLVAANDTAMSLDGTLIGFETGQTRLDTITMRVDQRGERLDWVGAVNNRPGTFDDWAHVRLTGFFDTGRMGMQLTQRNIQGKTGFDIGSRAQFTGDSLITLSLDPYNPKIAYKDWTVNEDNFVRYNFRRRHLDADLHMHGAGSTIALYSEHVHEHTDSVHDSDEDLVLELTDVKLQDWVALNPFAPSVRGNISANMHINMQEKSLDGNGTAGITDLYYGRERVGDFRADVDLKTRAGGVVNADLALWVNGSKTLTIAGAVNDSTHTSPFDLDMRMIHFPLRTVNPFIPGVARLTGTLNGNLQVSGDTKAPRLNGTLDFDSATVRVDMLGTRLTISDVKIPVEDNIVRFNQFDILACNDNPLTVNGTVDMDKLTDPRINLNLSADEMQLVDTRRAPRGASVYGKAFVSADARVVGDMNMLNVAGDVTVLPGTDVTYIMADAATQLQSLSNGDMVKFVNFADTAAVADADSLTAPPGMMLILDATLTVENGTTVSVDLDSKGSDKVQIKSQGELHYTQSPVNDGRVTGRLNVNGGFVRYNLPVMGQKLFNFNEGSYVAFSGDMMNPQLNIHATDRVRANVTQAGQNSRLIYFDVLLGVTGSLNNMNVAFDLETDDDTTVANELATMSPSQRASEAMNLLITNMYTGGETRADANLGGNALYSFLTSQLNSWAANTIRGVDLSFGISQYDRTVGNSTSQATQYSYRVSKALFNDRFKIVIGGEYSTDDDANRDLANDLINDVSIEYMLNRTGTMYVRIFRHTGYESILEGEITQTGVGFVYKRRINNLKSMFGWRRRRHTVTAVPVTDQSDKSDKSDQSDKSAPSPTPTTEQQ